MKTQTFTIATKWRNGELDARSVAHRLVANIDKLRVALPSMKSWSFIRPTGDWADEFDDVRPDILQFVEANVSRDEDDFPQEGDGYEFLAVGSDILRETYTAQTAHLSLRVGSPFANQFDFMIGSQRFPPDFSLITYPVYRSVLEALVASWPCPWALAYTFTIEDDEAESSGSIDSKPRAPFGGAWIAYLSAPLAAGLTPPDEIVSERTPGGGLILSAAPDRIDDSDPDHMRRSRMLTAIMTERVGLAPVSWPFEAELPARIGGY